MNGIGTGKEKICAKLIKIKNNVSVGASNHYWFIVKSGLLAMALLFIFEQQAICQSGQNKSNTGFDKKVSEQTMESIYQQIKTPYKYGLVLVPSSNHLKMDCPSVFRKHGRWYMTYIIFDGRGYETWLATSGDLLHWQTKGRIMSFSDSTDWDNNQKAGYVALEDYRFGKSYAWEKYKGQYYMSYFGGNTRGYESGLLSIGMAFSKKNPSKVHEWERLSHPILKSTDPDVRWWENHTQYKSTVIWDKKKLTGYPFVLYYNANGDSLDRKRGAERIGMAVSDDMIHWKRFGKNPILDHHQGITGDPVIQKIGNVYVLFYFGAFWKNRGGAFNNFACSYDLVHWTDWDKDPLIKPSEDYDEVFAHKSFVVKYKKVVYHFYCGVNKAGQRGIAVATSDDMGHSNVHFIDPPVKIKKNK